MNHYKSWSGLNNQLAECLCDSLRNRVTYFLTRYHEVHNSYGRAAIRLDGKELAVFSWIDMYKQDSDLNEQWEETGIWDILLWSVTLECWITRKRLCIKSIFVVKVDLSDRERR